MTTVAPTGSTAVPSPYDRNKTIAEGLLDVTVLIANATTLEAVVSKGSQYKYYNALLVLLSLSVFLQLIVAVLLLIIGAKESLNDEIEPPDNKLLTRLTYCSIGTIAAVLMLNIFISAFSVQL